MNAYGASVTFPLRTCGECPRYARCFLPQHWRGIGASLCGFRLKKAAQRVIEPQQASGMKAA